MTKTVNDEVLDAALQHLIDQADRMSSTVANENSWASIQTKHLSWVTVSAGDWTGPANGDTSGRKITLGQKANVEVSTTGSCQVISLCDTSGAGKILYTTDVSIVQTVTDGNTMTFNTWKVEILDPTP